MRFRLLIPLAVALLLCAARRAHGQSSTEPAWQAAAGHKMAFDVASVKLDTSGTFRPPSFALSTDNSYKDTGGSFHADFQLAVYIQFAYKLWLIPEQVEAMMVHLPAWVRNDRYEIEARAPGSPNAHPTKDQMRLMPQSLLAERFKFAAHFETHQGPILAMTLAKPGKPGPKLIPHDQGPPCDTAIPPAQIGPNLAKPKIFPQDCDVYGLIASQGTTSLIGSRNTTIDLLAQSLPLLGHLGRPVIDRTGLTGKYDFTMDFAMVPIGPGGGEAAVSPDLPGPTFLEALRDQLGLKLEQTEGPIQILVVDHIEKPTEN